MSLDAKGLWVPVVTPFYEGKFDEVSLIKLVKEVEDQVDGFVPCLSSGEGGKMSENLWEEVIKIVVENTEKPVVAGILNPSTTKIIELSEKAKSLGCKGVAVPLQGENVEAQKNFCKEISNKSSLPIILYNTENIHIENIQDLIDIAHNQNIVAIKDSSKNQEFFNEAVKIKKEGLINMAVLQGMENQLLESVGCDGYLISLANVEPELCKKMLEKPSEELNSEIMKKWDEFNLDSDTWYIGIKEALASRGIIRSSELIK